MWGTGKNVPNSHAEQHPRLVLFVPLNGTTTPKHVNEVRLHNLNGLVSASWNLEGELPSKLGESSVQLGSILEESGRDSTNYHVRMIQLGYLNVRTKITHSRSAGKATASRPMTVCGTQRRGKGLVPMSTNESRSCSEPVSVAYIHMIEVAIMSECQFSLRYVRVVTFVP